MKPKKKRLCYKYCFVPYCKSTTITTPKKRFIYVPKKDGLRQKWLKICSRKMGALTTAFYCCEDHFDLENDFCNVVQHKLTGCSLRLKEGVFPSKFNCQLDIEQNNSSKKKHNNIKGNKSNKLEGLPKDSRSSDSPDSPSHIFPTIPVLNPSLLAITQEPKMVVVDPDSDMVVEIDPRAFVDPEMSKSFSEPGPSSRVEPDSSMTEDIPLAMTCEQFPVLEPVSQTVDVKIKQEPDDLSYILSANVERELGKFSQGSPSISKEDSLFQPPVLIKEEIVSEDEV